MVVRVGVPAGTLHGEGVGEGGGLVLVGDVGQDPALALGDGTLVGEVGVGEQRQSLVGAPAPEDVGGGGVVSGLVGGVAGGLVVVGECC